MRRWLLILLIAMFATSGADCHAQWYRWYGWGNYNYGYNGGGTPESLALRSQAELTMAQGAAAENIAKANVANEQARSIYIDNASKYLEYQEKYQQMRREYRAAQEAKDQKRREDARARAALRPPRKTGTELYPRLSADQLDPLTGTIHWPDSLMGDEYRDDRRLVEDALQSQAELGPDDRSSKIIYDASHRMMTIRSRKVAELGSAGYSACRKFLNSLAIEGDHAREALQ